MQWGHGHLREDARVLRDRSFGEYAGSAGDSEAARRRMLKALCDLQVILVGHKIVYQQVWPACMPLPCNACWQSSISQCQQRGGGHPHARRRASCDLLPQCPSCGSNPLHESVQPALVHL